MINELRSLFFCQIEQFFRRTDGKDRKGDRFHSYTYSVGTSPKLVDMLRGPQLAALQQHRQSAKTQVSSCIRKPSQRVSFPFGEYRGSHGRAARGKICRLTSHSIAPCIACDSKWRVCSPG